MLVPHFENIFRSGLTLFTSPDKISIKILINEEKNFPSFILTHSIISSSSNFSNLFLHFFHIFLYFYFSIITYFVLPLFILLPYVFFNLSVFPLYCNRLLDLFRTVPVHQPMFVSSVPYRLLNLFCTDPVHPPMFVSSVLYRLFELLRTNTPS